MEKKKSNPIPQEEKIIALAGNPNVGKSTIFNSLTGLNQHTGNWPGKTVSNAKGVYCYENKQYTLVDLPGTYSLMAHSAEEEIARDFICFEHPDAVVIVTDATCLERNLNLVLQTMELCPKTIVCVNLLDEAKKKHITVDLTKLSEELGIPVIGAAARQKQGLEELMAEIARLAESKRCYQPTQISYPLPLETAMAMIIPQIEKHIQNLNSRWIALQLLDGSPILYEKISRLAGE